MANSADPDQLASEEANWSGAALFAQAEYIWVWLWIRRFPDLILLEVELHS